MEPRPPQILKTDAEEVVLTPEERATIESFETLPINWRSEFNLVLAFKKYKSAVEVFFQPDISESKLEEARRIIEASGLFFKDMGVREDETYNTGSRRICFAAVTAKDLNLISELWFGDHNNDPKVYKELGRMSGFPPSAIELFHHIHSEDDEDKQKKDSEEYAVSVEEKKSLPADLYAFSSFFMMSKKHMREGLEVARRWAEIIKAASPDLYQQVILERGIIDHK